MYTKVYPCWYKIPPGGTIDGFPNLWQAKCTYCREACDPPIVDSKIGSFDGFDPKRHIFGKITLVLIFSLGYEIFKYKYVTPKAIKDFESLKSEDEKDEVDLNKVEDDKVEDDL